MKNTSKILLSLLRSNLNEESHHAVNLDLKDWKDLYEKSKQQGVSALIFDAILNTENDMPLNIKMEWAFHNKIIASNHEKQKQVLNKLTEELSIDGIKIMVLKGLGLSLLYKHPEQRECGDIDIYCFGRYDDVNQIIENKGITIETEDIKHCSFVYDDVVIENHKMFTYLYNQADKIVAPEIRNLIDNECVEDERLPKVYLPSPNVNALYIMQHLISHLGWSGIVLRYLCDWILFLKRYHAELEWDTLHEIWKKSEQIESISLINSICIDFLGMPQEWFPLINKVSSKKRDWILNDIMNPALPSATTKNKIKKVYRKVMQHRRRCWKHKLLYHKPYPDSLMKDLINGFTKV